MTESSLENKIFNEEVRPTFMEYCIPGWGMFHYTGRMKEHILHFGAKFGHSKLHLPIINRHVESFKKYLNRLTVIHTIEISLPLSSAAIYCYMKHYF